MNDKNKYFYMICHELFSLEKYKEDHIIKSAKWEISKDVFDYLRTNEIFNFNIVWHTLCGFNFMLVEGTDIVKLMVEL